MRFKVRVLPTRGTAGKQGPGGRAGGAEMDGRRTEVAARPRQGEETGKLGEETSGSCCRPWEVCMQEWCREKPEWIPDLGYLKARQGSQQEKHLLCCFVPLPSDACVCVCVCVCARVCVCVCVEGWIKWVTTLTCWFWEAWRPRDI